MGEKRCPQCREVKLLAGFYRYGPEQKVTSFCRMCQGERAKARRAAGLVQALDRARYRNPDSPYRASVARQTKKWKARNKEKLRVHYVVENAIKTGRLVRQPCEVCGEKAQAHHADYGQPLAVQWLCPLHHARQHVAEGRMGRAS